MDKVEKNQVWGDVKVIGFGGMSRIGSLLVPALRVTDLKNLLLL